jgi:hypothetical protein
MMERTPRWSLRQHIYRISRDLLLTDWVLARTLLTWLQTQIGDPPANIGEAISLTVAVQSMAPRPTPMASRYRSFSIGNALNRP